MLIYLEAFLLTSILYFSIANSPYTPIFVLVFILLYIYNHIKLKKDNVIKGDEQRDFLTNLYNRSYCLKKIDFLINKNQKFSLFNIDLNNFKLINDVYGHDMGDLVLKEVGRRFDNIKFQGVTFSRFGGDEFVVLLEAIDKDTINRLGALINKSLQALFVVSQSEFVVGASIGVSRFPIDAKDSEMLLKMADTAMYYAKKSGSNDSFIISDESVKRITKRRKISEMIKKIDIENELFLEYQPRFDVKSKNLIGIEALVRWRHEEYGVIYPLDFISVAEELDMIKEVTKFVFMNALIQIKQWNEKYKSELVISLNVSNACIHNRIFFSNFKYMLENFNIKAQHIAIEVKERSLSISPKYMQELLMSINKLGVSIYLDNFGQDLISLVSLKLFNISNIKIDNEFIYEIAKDEDKRNLVNSIMLFAHGLGLKVTAVGVENEELYKILKDMNCDTFQGFYADKPLSADEFERKYLSVS